MPSVQLLDFEDNGLLIRHGRLYAIPVRRASVLPAASFRFSLATDTLAVQLTVPAVGPVRDFHPQAGVPCRAHHKKDRAKTARPLDLLPIETVCYFPFVLIQQCTSTV